MKLTQDVSFLSVYQVGNSQTTNYDVITYDTSNSQFPGGTTPSFQQTIATTTALMPTNQLPSAPSVAVTSGRMFNTLNDQFMSISVANDTSGAPFWSFYYYNPPVSGNAPFTDQQPIYNSQVPTVGGSNYAWAVMGNFRGDGLKEPVAVYLNLNGSTAQWGMDILGASTTQGNPPPLNALGEGAELYTSTTLSTPQRFPDTNQNSVVVGDFNGDGRDEIAVIMSDQQTIRFYSVNPGDYTISPMSPASLKLAQPVYRANLVSGQFVLPNQVDLVALGVTGSPNMIFEYVNTQSGGAGTFNPQQETPANQPQIPTNTEPPYGFFAYASPLIAPASQSSTFGPEQLVVGSQNASGDQNFWIGDFYVNKYAFTQLGYSNLGDDGCTLGMQVGNFDNETTTNGSSVYNPDPQVAFLYNRHGCTSGSPSLFVYDMNVPTNLQPVFQATNWLAQVANITVSATGNSQSSSYPAVLALDVSDVQGRSQQLGAPVVVTIPKQIQPDVVLGMPPMQVDYIIPPNPAAVCQSGTGNGVTTPCVANISYQPTPANTTEVKFTTAFNLTSTTSTSTSNTATTSYGLSSKVSVGAKISFNDLEENAKINLKDTATALYKANIQQQNSNYSSVSNSIQVTTGTDDYIFFTERDMILYYYPILGYNSDGHPEYLEFSQPSTLRTNHVDGATQDWYQPVQEPGNVLSYPWIFSDEVNKMNVAGIQSGFANKLVPITPKALQTCTLLGSATTSATATWTSNSSQSQSLGTTSSFSNDFSMSVSEGAGVSGIDSADVDYSVDIGASTSLSSLNVETATVASSTGVTATAPALYNFDGDSYFLANFIFGESNPSSTSIIQSLSPGTDQVTQGPIFVNYIADPVPQRPGGTCGSSSGQSQWEGMYQLPDVGFNHPQRWFWTPNGSNMGVSFNAANPANPVASHFYHMKGFFVTNQSSAANGPTRSSATIGDQLELTARVYNFSLQDTNDPSLKQPAKYIYVDFYGQPYCSGNVCGNAFEIGEAKLSQAIPGFKSRNIQGPNWITASVPFDTTGLPQGPMVFWVVTWMEDANGNRVQEITGHGLLHKPAENLTSIAQLQIEPYSNNVGIYGVHTQFMLNPPPAPGASLSHPAAPKDITLQVDSQVSLDSYLNVLGHFNAPEDPVDSISISYFDGDPRKGGTLFDHQVIHHIDANDSYVHRSSLQMTSCGTHTIFAEAFNGNSTPVISQGATVNVTVDPVALIEGMNTFLGSIQLPTQYARALTLNLQLAQSLFQKGETGRGIGSLKVFANSTNTIGGISGAQAKEKLARLAQQAATINSCEGGPTLSVSN